jgi:DNA invertase Pin-like site-specific DNA recombinase
MQKIGYGRVSTGDQNAESQVDALTKAGANKVFIEKYTGTKLDRPELNRAFDYLRAGDQLVITKLDRLGRSTKDLLALLERLNGLGVQLRVLDQNIDTSTAEGKFFFTIIGAVAEFERSLIVSRTRDGLAAARARGRVGGRKPKLSEKQQAEIRRLYAAKEKSVREIAELFSVSRPTVYSAVGSRVDK